MVPTFSLDQVTQHLQSAFKYRFKDAASQSVRMVGFLFARPEAPFARDEILPSIEYFHHRSGDTIDFFCVGYGWYSREVVGPDQSKVSAGRFREPGWGFSPRTFDEFRRSLESQTSWRYSGGVELLLTNARFEPDSGEVGLEWRSTIRCDLDRMKSSGAIPGVHQFFEDIFRAAESTKGDDPTWGFSDAQGVRMAGSGLKRLLLSLLPKSLGDDVRRVSQFAVVDVGRDS